MKKILNKENLIALTIYIVIFLIVFFALTKGNSLFGSTTDFANQHYLIPEYFRTLFYSNYNILPDFAMNLSGGVNIYYLAYYGFLSPIILISYIFPHVSMLNYIIISTSILTILSSFLFYLYLRKNKFNYHLSLIGGLLFLLAGPTIFHTHRHIMFINYLFFLVLGFFGVDSFVNKKKILLLTISIFLIILTSYYYSIGSIICLFALTIYKKLQNNEKINIKEFIKMCIPYILGVSLGMIIILPTAYVILNSRGNTPSSIPYASLLIPSLSFKYILYSPYSIGCSFISILSCLYFTIKGNKENRFISIIILLFASFGLFNYILNGTLYIDPKSLIPFMPLVLLITINFLKLVFDNKINKKTLITFILIIIGLSLVDFIINITFNSGNKGFILGLDKYAYSLFLILEGILLLLIIKIKKNNNIFKYYLVITTFIFCIIVNSNDVLMKKIDKETLNTNKDIINTLTNTDQSFYRINNQVGSDNYNQVLNINEYQTTIYTSTNNKNLKYLFYDTFKNAIFYRNREIITGGTNPLYNIFMGEKYIISKSNLKYEKINEENDIKVYLNEKAFPIGYATSNIVNQKDYDNYNYVDKQILMLKSAITNSSETNYKITPSTKETIKYDIIKQDNLVINKTDKDITINSDNGTMQIKLDNKYKDGLLFINFKNNYNASCNEKDTYITINGQRNKLTCKDWKYHNKNYTFYYTLSSNILNISIGKGKYVLSDAEIYYIPFKELNNLKDNIDTFNVTYNKNDTIKGDINVTKDGYFIIQIPYDKGFNVIVDNKEVSYEKVNNGVLGFKINKGNHDIEINYHSPYKKEGIIISLTSLIILITLVIWKHQKGESNGKNNNN